MARLNRNAFLKGAAALSALSLLAACGETPEVSELGKKPLGDDPGGPGSGSGAGGDSGFTSGASSENGGTGAGDSAGSGTSSSDGGAGPGDGGGSDGSGANGSGNGGAGGGNASGNGGAFDPGPTCGDDATATPDHPWHPPFEIPLADIELGFEKSYVVASANHNHFITVTDNDFAELKTTGQIVKTSTSDWGHSHQVVITCPVV